ncbi:MAG: UbiA family prenyltransferase, partial [Lysobacteraceae bacterium]
MLVLANPGFFNHDEWQRLDEIERYGFRDYASRYGALQAGPDFGFPVRPLGFLQQGVSALFMKTVPLVPHLIDVLIHGIAVVQVFLLGGVFGAPRKRAMAAALLFALSPLTTLSVGWVGASFDRWYVIFVLAAVAFARADTSVPHDPEFGDVLRSLYAFAAFCLGASAIDLVTAVLDVESDRAHPTKRHRPIASGEVGVQLALVTSVLCVAGALSLAWLADPIVLAITGGYILLNFSYSVRLKHIVLVDVFCIATGFML